jgi:tripartite-type tricarboxylate transporter receptor subunit TctC
MKRLLAILLATLALSANAGQLVPIVWPFATGANQANFIRVIVEQANKEQNKYTFYYDNKPGAGGTIAARYVEDYKGIAILSSSSSYWIRPEFYPNESYKTSDFKPVLIECTGQPYSLVSAKYKSLEEIRKEKILNIGVILGSLTEANAREVQTLLPDTKLNFIPFNGTLVSTQEMIAGRLDLNIDLPAELKQWTDLDTVHVIGASGTKSYPGLPTWDSQGIKGFGGLVSNYQMVVSAKVDEPTRLELHKILRKAANNSAKLPALYDRDRCTGANMDYKETTAIYSKWSEYWPRKLQVLKKVNNE